VAHGYREELLLLPFRAEVGWPAPLNITRALASYRPYAIDVTTLVTKDALLRTPF